MIIHNIGKMIGRQFICCFPQNLVIYGVGVYLYVPPDKILHLYYPVFWRFESDSPIVSTFQQMFHLIGSERKRVFQLFSRDVIIDESGFVCLCGSSFGVKLLRGVESVIGKSLAYKLFCILSIYRFPFRLSVWSIWVFLGGRFYNISLFINPFVTIAVAPFERFDDISFCSRYQPL